MGDAWTPIRRSNHSALTLGEAGFTASILRDLIVSQEGIDPARMQQIEPGPGPAWFTASCLIRGQGTTAGFHEIRVRIDAPVRTLLLAAGPERDRLVELSGRGLEIAGEVHRRALRPALFSLLEGGPEGWPDTGRAHFSGWIERWMREYTDAWRSGYFPWLWHAVGAGTEKAEREWIGEVRSCADAVFRTALRAAPARSGRSHRSRVRAESILYGSMHRLFGKEETHV